jgi:hypothetical protein
MCVRVHARVCVASLGFKLNMFYLLLPEDGSQPPKHADVKIVHVLYVLCMCTLLVFNNVILY